MKITRKLAILVTVPLVAVIAFAGLALVTTGGQAIQAERLRSLVAVGGAGAELAHRLQTERAAAVSVLVGAGTAGAGDTYLNAIAGTDEAVRQYRRQRQQLTSVPAGAAGLLDQVDRQLGLLGPLRQQVQSGSAAASAVAFGYRIVIASAVSFREAVAQAGGAPADIADQIRASVDLSHAAEAVGQQQVAVLRAVDAGSLSPAAQQEITATRTAYTDALVSFSSLAPPQWRSWWENTRIGDDVLRAQELEDSVSRTAAGGTLRLDETAWLTAMAARIDRIRDIESRADAEVLTRVTALRDDAWRLAAIEAGVVLVAVAGASLLAVRLGRPILRGLRWLREDAHTVAYTSLPQVVAALGDPANVGNLNPPDFVTGTSPVRVEGRDEVADVARAFDAVHRETVRIAGEQAQLRFNVAAMFAMLARRLQRRVIQLTTQLDEAERGEQDPTRLDQLFRVDHLITLMGRTTDSLLVLGGQAPARVRTTDVALLDVLRAGVSHIESYERVAYHAIDDGVAVVASVIDEVVLLLAELLDNATTFSMPGENVSADARYLHDRVVIQITDRGVGIEPNRRAQLNQRLANPPQVDVDAVRAMGLTVVGLIAARYGIGVELRPGIAVGTIAEVTLPAGLFRLVSTSLPIPPVDVVSRPEPLPAVTIGGVLNVPPLRAAAAAEQTAELPIYRGVRADTSFNDDSVDRQVRGGQGNAADAGWEAARRAAVAGEHEITPHGLPRRVRRAQLVPGGVPDPLAQQPTKPRDPRHVSAVMDAYARGVSTSRARRAQPAAAAATD